MYIIQKIIHQKLHERSKRGENNNIIKIAQRDEMKMKMQCDQNKQKEIKRNQRINPIRQIQSNRIKQQYTLQKNKIKQNEIQQDKRKQKKTKES